MNKSDSEKTAAILEEMGFKVTKNVEKSKIILINTCAVKKPAEDRFFSYLKKCNKIKRRNKDLKIGVTGCLINSKKDEIDKLSDFSFQIKDLQKLPELINLPDVQSIKKTKKQNYLSIKAKRNSKVHAYIPIMSGCDNFCSYCAVPLARGREISRPSKEILAEISDLISKGYKAFTLLGQNVNSYGKGLDEKTSFPELLKKICDLKGDFWIWFYSAHPKDMSKELINVIAAEKKVCNYLHFALHSGSDKILKSMNRHYNSDQCEELINQIYQKIPEISLSTDVIVGFPGETEADFERTKKLCKNAKFEMSYTSRFSKRPYTKANEMKETVADIEKKSRERQISAIIRKNNLIGNKRFIGKKKKVLVDMQIISKNKNKVADKYIGKTAEFKTVKFTSKKKTENGDFVNVIINNGLNWGLEGENT